MKLPHLLYALGSTLALGSPTLWSQAANATASPANGTTAMAEWTHGFEASDGYAAGQLATGTQVAVMGGSATVVSGDAAEGDQFLRFVPTGSDNALVLQLPPEVSGGSERTIRFQVRLTDTSQNSRLVLSYGATVALRLVPDGVEIEAGTTPPRRVNVVLPKHGWLELGLRENSQAAKWDLLVAGQPAITGLPLQNAPQALSDLLIFADGSLDLDAVHVAKIDNGAPASQPTNQATAPTDPAILNAIRTARGPDWAQRRDESLAQARTRARNGELDEMERLLAAAASHEPDTAEWHLEIAQMLSMLAFALHDEGRPGQAAPVAQLALPHLKQAGEKPFPATDPAGRATVEFVAGQLWENLLFDPDKAAQAYGNAAAIDPEHKDARVATDRIARKRQKSREAETSAAQGGRP